MFVRCAPYVVYMRKPRRYPPRRFSAESASERSCQANLGAAARNATAMADLERRPDVMEMHDMLAYLRLAEEAPGEIASRMLAKLSRGARDVITLDPTK